jgi:hypothetical protein
MISIVWPGRLSRVDESYYESVSEFVEFALSLLTHHGYLLRTPVPSSVSIAGSSSISLGTYDQLIVDHDQIVPSFTLFGHNLGAIIAFEITREIERGVEKEGDKNGSISQEKRGRVCLPPETCLSLVVSGSRPPAALTQFNKDEKSRKFSRLSDRLLLDRLLELGAVPRYLSSRRDILQCYLPGFRAGECHSLFSLHFQQTTLL